MFYMCTGGALSQARGALSSWWSTFTTVQSPEADGSAAVTVAEEAKTHENEESSNHSNRQGESVKKPESRELLLLSSSSSS
jgi:hypothetical protein